MKALRLSLFVLLASVLVSCNSTTAPLSDSKTDGAASTIKTLQETRTTQYFTDAPVPLSDMTTIVDAGRNASSGRNNQNWYFAAIINQEIIKEFASTLPKRKPRPAKEGQTAPPAAKLPKAQFADAPAIIALASPNSNDFSLGLACQNMVVAASALGYGTKIVMSGRDQLNTPKYMEMLQIPEGMKVAVVIYVGKEDTELIKNSDAITGASSRKPMQEVSIVIE